MCVRVCEAKYALVNRTLFELNEAMHDFCTKINDSMIDVDGKFPIHVNHASSRTTVIVVMELVV